MRLPRGSISNNEEDPRYLTLSNNTESGVQRSARREPFNYVEMFSLIMTAACLGVAKYVRIGGTSVNLFFSDVFIVPAVLLFLGCGTIGKKPILLTPLIALTLGLWVVWEGFIAVSLFQPIAKGYVRIPNVVWAFVKPAACALYLIIIPLWVLNRGGGSSITWKLISVWVFASTIPVLVAGIGEFDSVTWYGSVRFRGFFEDPNLYAVYASQSAALSLGLASTKQTSSRLLGFAGFAVNTLGVLMSASRTGTVALLLTLVTIGLLDRSRQSTLIAAASVSLVALFAATAVPASPGLLRLRQESYRSGLAERLETWSYAWQAIEAHPFVGVGREHLPEWKTAQGVTSTTIAHNSYIGPWAETGLGGALAFLSLFIIVPVIIFARMASRRTFRQGLVPALIGAYIPVWVGGIGLNIENYRGGWFLLGLCIAVMIEGRQRLAAQPVEPALLRWLEKT